MTFLGHVITGLSLGSIYAIIALGCTMVYGIAKMLNFAHGDIIMIGAYVCFIAVSSLGLPPAVGILPAIILCTVLGGLGSIRGSMIAAALLYVLPELLRSFDLAEYRMLLYAIILIIMMLATNNPQMKRLVGKIVPKRTKGGAGNG